MTCMNHCSRVIDLRVLCPQSVSWLFALNLNMLTIFNLIFQSKGVKEKVKQKEMLIRLIKELPKCNQDTLKYLLKHLLRYKLQIFLSQHQLMIKHFKNRVQEHKDDNRMHVQNLAIVFGPTLMWPETNSKNLSHDTMLNMHSNRLIELLLLEYNSLFLWMTF